MKRNIVVLGSTGSIGVSALGVVSDLSDMFNVVGVSARSSFRKLAIQARDFGCDWAWLAEGGLLDDLDGLLPSSCDGVSDEDRLCELVSSDGVDIVLCAVVGVAALRPVLAAIRAGKDIALASKEILVMAGELVMGEAKRYGVRILPVDSEHSAIFQCLEGVDNRDINRLILTASGGPFRGLSVDELRGVSLEQALRHPTWDMGKKITIDSATLMNKGLELIEAHWLFSVSADRLEVVIHPQSIVHSMVEFVDGSILAQMGYPDMCLPIQYALTYPRRVRGGVARMNFMDCLDLHFESPNHVAFPAIGLALQVIGDGGTMGTVFNAANEVAVERFCRDEISFCDIWGIVEAEMSAHRNCDVNSLEDILAVDEMVRRSAKRRIL